jgi:hypothetical protein
LLLHQLCDIFHFCDVLQLVKVVFSSVRGVDILEISWNIFIFFDFFTCLFLSCSFPFLQQFHFLNLVCKMGFNCFWVVDVSFESFEFSNVNRISIFILEDEAFSWLLCSSLIFLVIFKDVELQLHFF